MHFLVTGASGFVGKNLCAQLLSAGHQVTGVTRKKEDLPGVKTAHIQDWQSGGEWISLLQGVDVVVHLAARVHIMKDPSPDPLREFRLANVQATESLARAVAQSKVQKFIFLSSLHVSGTETHGRPFVESDPPQAEGSYAISKLEAENFLFSFFKNSPVDLVVVRPPLIYGPGCGGNFLSLMKIVQKIPVLPFGSFDKKRSMIFVGDLSDFIYRVALAPRKGSLYLISDGIDLSFAELLRRLSEKMSKAGNVWSIPLGFMHALMRLAGKAQEFHKIGAELRLDSGAAVRDFDWKPKYGFEEGLRQTVGWYLKK